MVVARLRDVLERLKARPELHGFAWQDVLAVRLKQFQHVVYDVVFADRIEVLLMRKIGQVQMLHPVNANPEPSKGAIRKALLNKLRTDVGCTVVPPVKAALEDPLLIKKVLKDTRLERKRYRCRKALGRRNGWHQWLCRATGRRQQRDFCLAQEGRS